MNLQQLLHKIESFAKKQKFVNSVTIGSVYENWNGAPDKKYGALNIDIPQLIVNSNMQQMQVYLYQADRLTHDHSNEYEIRTTAELVLNNIINYCANLGDITEGWTINFFTQQFADELAGGYVSFYVEIEKPIGDCLIDDYEDEPSAILYIVENGEYDTTNYKKVIVNIPSVTTEEITQEEYDALTEYDPYKIYLITE